MAMWFINCTISLGPRPPQTLSHSCGKDFSPWQQDKSGSDLGTRLMYYKSSHMHDKYMMFVNVDNCVISLYTRLMYYIAKSEFVTFTCYHVIVCLPFQP